MKRGYIKCKMWTYFTANIKILEIWKSLIVEGYPLKIATKQINQEATNTRAMTSNQPIAIGTKLLTQRSCMP